MTSLTGRCRSLAQNLLGFAGTPCSEQPWHSKQPGAPCLLGTCMLAPCHVTKRSLITLCVLQVARTGNSTVVP